MRKVNNTGRNQTGDNTNILAFVMMLLVSGGGLAGTYFFERRKMKKFFALRHEVRVENDDGTTSEEIKRRTYDLKCSVQERMIQVSIPADVPVKDFPYNAEVELINPVADTVNFHCCEYMELL